MVLTDDDLEVDVTALQLNASPSEAREASSSSLAARHREVVSRLFIRRTRQCSS